MSKPFRYIRVNNRVPGSSLASRLKKVHFIIIVVGRIWTMLRRLLVLCSALLCLIPVSSSFLLLQYYPKGFKPSLRSTLLSSKLTDSFMDPWFSHSDLKRDRGHVLDSPLSIAKLESSRFILVEASRGVYHYVDDPCSSRSATNPLFLSYRELDHLLGSDEIEKSLEGDGTTLIAWVGHFEGSNFFVCHLREIMPDGRFERVRDTQNIRVSNLRNFGDRLRNRMDAAILSTSNGLVEFHKSHPFCAQCGSPTRSAKCGACRKCTTCKSSCYPRIDVATIMLITCNRGEYALLGRKAGWPKGRYSTLAGFCEVGETLEQCCAREVFEESGVRVRLDSIRFIHSQPWPFPRSLMVGFRGEAKQEGDVLPTIRFDEKELEDVQWFHRDFVKDRLDGGSTALDFEPDAEEEVFHIPGQSSLGRMLITQWANSS